MIGWLAPRRTGWRQAGARGYSWPPFEKGNTASLTHGARSPRMIEPLAEAIVNEREGYGPFTTLTELHTLLGLDTQYVSALRPYLKVVAP